MIISDYLNFESLPGYFVNYNDFTEYDISSYLFQTGLRDMFSFESGQGYYLLLIYLFYTNLSYEDNDDNVLLTTLVKVLRLN